jgi:glyoxylase-like metal-dependent hydrolase (beta-lactamase superfamily II)
MAYNSTKISEGFWSIDEGMVRCYLIEGPELSVLIDTCSSGGDEFHELVHSLTDKDIQVVFTHCDQDHIGGHEYYGAPMLHPAEFSYFRERNVSTKKIKPILENEQIVLGDRKIEVILIPGHTPGSIALLDRKNRCIFTGDTISDSHIFMFGAGRSLEAYIESLAKLEKYAESVDTIYTCHGTMSLAPDWIKETKAAAIKLLAGELIGTEPPMDLPCKLYTFKRIHLLF